MNLRRLATTCVLLAAACQRPTQRVQVAPGPLPLRAEEASPTSTTPITFLFRDGEGFRGWYNERVVDETVTPADDLYQALVSYDGLQVLYRRATSPEYKVFDRATRTSRILAGRAQCFAGRWSPDSDGILWRCLTKEGTGQVLTTDSSGAGRRVVPLGVEQERSGIPYCKAVEWSADGESIYCLRLREVHEVQKRSLTGTLLKVWPLHLSSDDLIGHGMEALAASPNGSKVLVSAGLASRKEISQGIGSILMLDLETGEIDPMVPPELEAYTPTWLPDGDSFVFSGRSHVDADGNRYRLDEEGISTGPFSIYRRFLDRKAAEVLIRGARVIDYQ